MADVKISALPAATTPLAGTELVPIVQSGVTSQVSVNNLTAGKTVAASTVNVDANTASAAVRVTQTGSGNALLVEDSANPDATPFVVSNDGRVVVGHTAPLTTAPGTASSPLQVQTNIASADFASVGVVNWVAGVQGTGVQLSKSRSGVIGTRGIVSDGDAIGRVQFNADDGVGFIAAARIEALVDGTPGTNDMPGRLVFSTTADGASSPTERMRIDSTGAIGVGVTPVTQNGFTVTRNIGGSAFSAGIVSDGRVQTTASSRADYFLAAMRTSGSVPIIVGYQAQQATHTGTLTDQVGFRADASLIGATNNFGFFGNIPAGANRWNFYAGGTANNYFAGNVGVGNLTPLNKLDVNGSFGRGAPVTKTGNFTLADTENWIICNGAGSITVTFPAASSWTGREVMIKTIAAQTVVSASSNVVPLAGGAAGTAILPASAGAWATLVSDGTNWIIMQS